MPLSAMPEFFDLSAKDRLDALSIVADASGRPLHLLEKDIWVVWALRHLFSGPYAEHLVFKGGTSLSKAYGVIRRFSEDVDLTYDIRAIAADLVGNSEAPLPATKSQEKKWTREIHVRLDHWVATEVVPRLEAELVDANLPGDDLMPILAADYQHMIDDGLFLDDAEPFTALVARCRSIERKANAGS